MLAKFIRFKKENLPMSPGPGRVDIDKARLKPPQRAQTDPRAPVIGGSRDEIMDEIDVGDVWVTLRVVRPDGKGRAVLLERVVHVSSVRDWEPLEEPADEEKPAKGGKGSDR